MASTKRPMFEPHVLEGLCRSIGDTTDGLSGTEIGQILVNSNIPDIDSQNTKWKRLYSAFADWQNKNRCSNHILKFVQDALQPVRYIGKEEAFHNCRLEVNKRLYFIGIELTEEGKFRIVEKATTIAESEQRASRLKHKLENRNVHSAIFKYCKAELLVENYFHSVFEATKSIADRLRTMTGLYADGNALAETSFSTSNPLIKINLLITDTDRSEHIGLCNLIKGIFGLIRNPTAHEPKIKFEITEEEALDILNTVSFIHKRLDKVI
ncbi:TIGR02391 family protein [Flavobacterium sp. P4023]|uniref:TIGR02391 family protein n=1 Tax=Flavobacterium flabelliforme TaxID=2816119 RepID=A0ABS5CTY1_9FLAO|nr:TIGR02391 family protein [Flavobacterium flabelliforme]MBP4142075.1 TIGR02391 family protein [Flavobacterium flabelliforme]